MKRYERAVAGVARRFGLEISRSASAHNRLPTDATEVEAEMIARIQPLTMTSASRMWALIRATRYVIEQGIPGDFVECGVWRGGSVLTIAETLHQLGVSDRNIWLYDTFSGMTEPTAHDVESNTGVLASDMLAATTVGDGRNVWCVASRGDVEANLRSSAYPFDRYHFVEGDVLETLQVDSPESISLLRLDTDWYASTRRSLEVLYPKLVVGGVCILDDYGHWQGARQAVDEYLRDLPGRPLLMPIDYSGRVFIKPISHAKL